MALRRFLARLSAMSQLSPAPREFANKLSGKSADRPSLPLAWTTCGSETPWSCRAWTAVPWRLYDNRAHSLEGSGTCSTTVPEDGKNELWCPSLHRTRYGGPLPAPCTSMITPRRSV